MLNIQDKEELNKLIAKYERHARLAILFFLFAGIFMLLGLLYAKWNYIVGVIWSIMHLIKHIQTERIAKQVYDIINKGK